MFAIPDVTIDRDCSNIKSQKARRSYLLSSTWLTATLILGCASYAQAGNVTLPVGGKVSSGSASVSNTSSSTVVSQSSATAIINWNSFSIGQGDTVQFNNGTGSTLNRVTGGSLSSIDGLLSATGSVYLINPNGVIIGKGGTVKTGGSFIASTLDISDANYLQGGDLSFSGSSLSSVINLGKVGSLGGDVTFMAAEVENDGTITAASGSVGLVAGQSILLSDASVNGGLFTVRVGGTDTSVSNKGAISAAAVALQANGGSIYALAGNTSGVINATGISQLGGKIYLTAGTGGTVDVSGSTLTASTSSGNGGEISLTGQTIDVASDAHLTASATSATGTGGTISVIAGVNNGSLTFAGIATAKGGKTSGDGGRVETSGSSVDFDGAIVNTSATKGKTGTWLTDPYDLTVDAAAASTIDSNLATTNVTLSTTATGTSGPGNANASGVGDINIDAPITWSSSNSLTLSAYLGININAPITVTGAGGVNLTYNTSSASNLGFAGSGTIDYGPVNNGASLTINGSAYTLLYSMAQLDAIDGINAATDTSETAYGPGLAGNYAVATNLNASGTVYQMALLGTNITPTAADVAFTGTLEGLGHSVSGLTITQTAGTTDTGLIGTNGGTVRDLGLTGAQISGTGTYVAALIGESTGLVINDYSTGSVKGLGSTSEQIGGLVGQLFDASLTNSYSSATVTGSTDPNANSFTVGGLVGQSFDGIITGSYATGAVTGFAQTGGLAGSNDDGHIIGSYATGAVTGSGDNGGLVGDNYGTIAASYATGQVTGIGGFASISGGLVGQNYFGVVTTSYAAGAVSANGANAVAGGLIGTNGQTSSVAESYATGAVTGNAANIVLGGLVGKNSLGTIGQSWSSGAVSSTGATPTMGGFVGANGSTISSSYWDTQSSGQSTGIGSDSNTQSGNIQGLTTAQALTTSSYVNWDFNNVWVASNGSTRPFLLVEYSTTITNAHQLQLMGLNLSASYTLGANINASETSLTDVSGMWGGNGFGSIGTLASSFYGTFNGEGHTISNLAVSGNNMAYAGLFGVVGTLGSVSNVGLVNYEYDNTTGATIGGLVGANYGTLSNVYASGSLYAPDLGTVPTAGGLVGLNYGTISNAYSSGVVSSGGYGGGLVGENSVTNVYGTIEDSYSTASVNSTSANGAVGGLVGWNEGGIITQAYASGAVNGEYDVGGLVGLNQGSITEAYATGSVQGFNQVGGLIGSAGWIDLGGVVFGSAVDQTYATGFVVGNSNVGGLIGYNSQYGVITHSYWDTSTTGQSVGIGVDAYSQTETGLTTAQFQSGSPPSGLTSPLWATGAGLYPYLKPLFANGIQAVSGFTYANAAQTAVPGVEVSLMSSGTLLGTASSGANGYYYVFVPTGTIASGTNTLLAATGNAATLSNAAGTLTQTGLNLYTNTLAGTTTDTSLSLAKSDLLTAALAQAGSNTLASFAIDTANGTWLTYNGTAAFVVDQPQDVASNLVINAPNAAITLSDAATVETTGTLALLSGTSDQINADITVKGAGTVDLLTSMATLSGLAIGQGDSLSFENGDGTVATSSQGGSLKINGNPYSLLYSLSDVAGVNYGTGYYALAHSLNATGSNLSASLVGTLNGTFEGLGNSISNVNIYGADTFTGVFGIVNATGTVRDLTLSGSTVTSSGYSLGALVGYNNGGTVYNDVASNDTVTGGGNTHVGGLVGYNTGTVSDSSSSGTVSGSGQYAGIGGLVGWNTGTLIGDTSSASVTGTASNAFDGGLAGVNNGGTISTSGFTGTVSADGWAVGGLVGYNLGGLTSDTSAGTVTGTGSLSFVGGLAGVDASGFTISSSSSSATVNGTGFSFGGLVGYNQGTLTSDSASGSVTGNGNSYVGGLAGFNLGTMTTDYATGNVSSNGATSQVGGLVGQNFSGSITGSYATGTVTGTGSNGFVGGLIGENKASVSQSYATGDVTGAGFSAGGLVGWNQGTLTQVKYTTGTVQGTGTTDTGGLVGYNLGSIDQAYTNATVSGVGVNIGIGGLIGWNAAGTVSNTYVLGSVTGGNAFVGGVAGVNQSTIEYSYAAGHVTGTGSFTGGFAGYNSGTLLDAYYDDQTTGQAAGTQANGSKGVSTATLKGSLPTGFSASLWSQTTGQYPTLTNEP